MEMVFVITHIIMASSFLTMLFAGTGLNRYKAGKELPHRLVVSSSHFLKITPVELSTVLAGILTALM